jgi:hypothetical protein
MRNSQRDWLLLIKYERKRKEHTMNNIDIRACDSCFYTNRDNKSSSKCTNNKRSRGGLEGKVQEYPLDSGATTHVMTSETGAINLRKSTGYPGRNGEKCARQVAECSEREQYEQHETKGL